MDRRARSSLTLLVLVLMLVVGLRMGWTQLTQPLGAPDLTQDEPPVCTNRTVEAGSRIGPGDVTVSVYNGGSRDGLAGRTLEQLANRGFGIGDSGNARRRVPRIQIWTEQPRHPAVRLVRTHLAKNPATIIRREGLGPGITVLVGDGWNGLVKGRRQLPVKQDAEICSPPEAEPTP